MHPQARVSCRENSQEPHWSGGGQSAAAVPRSPGGGCRRGQAGGEKPRWLGACTWFSTLAGGRE